MFLPRPAFRFDASQHRYYCAGVERPHITGLLERAGLVDDTWFTEESSIRGQAVHRLTADYDLEALDIATLVSSYRGYVLAHVDAMRLIPHQWEKVEEPNMHPEYLFGGRPDRVGRIYGQKGVLEGKTTAAPARVHEIQTAIQVVLESYGDPVPPEFWWRGALYWKANGKWRLIQHVNRGDFDEARRIIRLYCPVDPSLGTAPAGAALEPRAGDRRRHRRDAPAAPHLRAAARRLAGTAGI
jgi:hypothetical protein